MVRMAINHIIPAAIAYKASLLKEVSLYDEVYDDTDGCATELAILDDITRYVEEVRQRARQVEDARVEADAIEDAYTRARASPSASPSTRSRKWWTTSSGRSRSTASCCSFRNLAKVC